jgi:peptidyl-dipeptidase A
MAKSRDYNKLLDAWWGWRNESGRKMRDLYRRYVDLTNKGARENGYTDRGQAWRGRRHKLTKVYPGKVVEDGYIDAHLLGNMWAQTWVNIFDLVEPYKNKSSLDVTSNMRNDPRYNTAEKLTKLAEDFFLSLGLKRLPAAFYNKSLLEKPKDREVVCHASAWDFRLYKDVR